MKQRIDDLLPHSTFRLDGEEFYLRKFENGAAWCETVDNEVVVLPGHLKADEYRVSSFNWLRAVLP